MTSELQPTPSTHESQGALNTDREPVHWPYLWPVIIIVMLVSQVSFMLMMVYVAVSDQSFAVEPDYYQKALNWDNTAAQRRANAQLGWSIDILVSDTADIFKHRDILCSLADGSGNPISDADIQVVMFPRARGRERTSLTLSPMGLGRYTARTRISRPGIWEVRIAASQGNVRFTRVQEIEIATAKGPQ